jgi:hypothetical protein
MPVAVVAERLGISRNTLYTRFDDPALDWDFISSLGRVIREDIIRTRFTKDAPPTVQEPSVEYRSELEKCRQELLDLRAKHIELLEAHNLLKDEYFALKDQMGRAGLNARAG